MTQTTVSPITITYADMPDRAEVAEAFAAFVALDPASTLYDLFVALRDNHDIDVSDLVDCILGEMMSKALWKMSD